MMDVFGPLLVLLIFGVAVPFATVAAVWKFLEWLVGPA
jgi:hypothetical protein